MHLRSLLSLSVAMLLAICSASAQSIVGAWASDPGAGPGQGVVIFLSNGYYLHVEDASPSDESGGGQDGYEVGLYTRNTSNGAFSITQVIDDTNGDIGPSSLSSMSNLTWSFTGSNTSELNIPDESATETLSRVTGSDAIFGAWLENNSTFSTAAGASSFAAVVFFADHTYYHFQQGTTSGGGFSGIERGTYAWDSSTDTFTLSSVGLNTNGEWGLSHDPGSGGTASFVVSGDTLTVDGEAVLNRVSAIPEPSTYAALAGLGALGLAFWQRRRKTA